MPKAMLASDRFAQISRAAAALETNINRFDVACTDIDTEKLPSYHDGATIEEGNAAWDVHEFRVALWVLGGVPISQEVMDIYGGAIDAMIAKQDDGSYAIRIDLVERTLREMARQTNVLTMKCQRLQNAARIIQRRALENYYRPPPIGGPDDPEDYTGGGPGYRAGLEAWVSHGGVGPSEDAASSDDE